MNIGIGRAFFLFCICYLTSGAATHGASDGYLVGVYYFSGWWRTVPNKWIVDGHDWRSDYPGRVPILGEYNDQETMDREILSAAGHGVNFFQILWYPDGGPLNAGVRNFLASTNAGRMKFTLEFVNHPPFALDTNEKWEAACKEWSAAMKHPSYLRVDGRPVLKIHGLDYFYTQNSNDIRKVAQRLDAFRRIAKEEGLPEPLIAGGVMPEAVPLPERAAPFDFVTSYMNMPDLPKRAEPYPYDLLVQHATEAWDRYASRCSKFYVPYVPSGWDPRPWADPRASFAFPTRAEWKTALEKVKAALDKYPRLGVPVKSGRQKMLLIYAWNEFGEGGIVAPTQGEQEMKLNAIQEVFGN